MENEIQHGIYGYSLGGRTGEWDAEQVATEYPWQVYTLEQLNILISRSALKQHCPWTNSISIVWKRSIMWPQTMAKLYGIKKAGASSLCFMTLTGDFDDHQSLRTSTLRSSYYKLFIYELVTRYAHLFTEIYF
jgi:hypothetical protein